MTNGSPNAGPGDPGEAPRRLQRRTDDEMVAGVAAGLADYFGIDVTLVRLAIVLLALSGTGVVAYVVAWIVMPVAPAGTPRNPKRTGPSLSGGQAVAGAILIVVGAVTLLDNLWWWDEGFLVPLALVGVGAVLLLRPRSGGPPDTEGPSDSPGSGDPGSGDPGSGDPGSGDPGSGDPGLGDPGPGHLVPHDPPVLGRGNDPTGAIPASATDPTLGFEAAGPATTTATREPPPDAEAPEHSPVGVAVGAGLVVAGLAWLLIVTGVIDAAIGDALAGLLVVLGLGLVAGAWWGRMRWLAWLAVPVVMALVAVAVIGDGSLAGPWGDRTYRPTSIAEVDDPYRVGVGELLVDLTGLEVQAGSTMAVTATVGAGSLRVVVPDGVSVVIDAHVRAGQIRLPGDDGASGWNVDRRWTDDRAPAGAGRLELDLGTTFGEVEVDRG